MTVKEKGLETKLNVLKKEVYKGIEPKTNAWEESV